MFAISTARRDLRLSRHQGRAEQRLLVSVSNKGPLEGQCSCSQQRHVENSYFYKCLEFCAMPQSDSHHAPRYKLTRPDGTVTPVVQCSSHSDILSSVHSTTLNAIQTRHLGLGNHLHQVIEPKHKRPAHRNIVSQVRLHLSEKLIH